MPAPPSPLMVLPWVALLLCWLSCSHLRSWEIVSQIMTILCLNLARGFPLHLKYISDSSPGDLPIFLSSHDPSTGLSPCPLPIPAPLVSALSLECTPSILHHIRASHQSLLWSRNAPPFCLHKADSSSSRRSRLKCPCSGIPSRPL